MFLRSEQLKNAIKQMIDNKNKPEIITASKVFKRAMDGLWSDIEAYENTFGINGDASLTDPYNPGMYIKNSLLE